MISTVNTWESEKRFTIMLSVRDLNQLSNKNDNHMKIFSFYYCSRWFSGCPPHKMNQKLNDWTRLPSSLADLLGDPIWLRRNSFVVDTTDYIIVEMHFLRFYFIFWFVVKFLIF